MVENDLHLSGMFGQTKEGFVSNAIEAQDFVNNMNARFSHDVVKRVGENMYKVSIPNELLENYVVETKDGKEVVKIIDLHNSIHLDKESWNRKEMFSYLNYPEITTMTDAALKSFLLSINPNFRIEEIDNLSVDGHTKIKEFLIQVRTLSKFKVMPEEVAHVLVTLLPNDHPLKKEMLDNITSFPIYSLTYNKYKDTYLTSEGKPDFEKIKQEAAAKLVAEYVTAKATGDTSRLEALAKPKQNFIQRWFYKLVKFLGLAMKDYAKSYADIAGMILSGKNDLTLRDVEDLTYTESYWYNLSEQDLYERAYEITEKVPPPKMLEIITQVSKEFGRRFNDILRDEKYAALNEELKREGTTIGKLNRLIDVKKNLDESDIDLESALDADEYLKGVKQFLEAVDRMKILATAILNVINNQEKAKTFDEAISRTTELESYFGLYETFNNLISGKMASELAKAEVGEEVVNDILDTKKKFDTITTYILAKQEHNILIFWREIVADMNDGVSKTLTQRLDAAIATGNKKIIDEVKRDIEKKGHIVTEDAIKKMLSGTGKDIDGISTLNHLLNAAILNGDPYVSGLTKFIQERLNKERQKALEANLTLMAKIDVFQKQLNEPAYVTGSKIVQIDTVYDKSVEGKERQVVAWLNPWKGIFTARDALKAGLSEARTAYESVDKNDEEEKNRLFEDLKAKRKNYNEFLNKYWNRPFLKEYYTFRERFEENPDFVEAMDQYREVSRKITQAEDILSAEPENEDVAQEIAILRRERANLRNELDIFGEPKPESELRLVRALNDYFEKSGEFMEIDETQTKRAFEIARNRYKQQVDFALQDIRRSNPKGIAGIEKKLRVLLKDKRIYLKSRFEAAGEEDIDYDLIQEILMDRWDEKNEIEQKNDAFRAEEARILKEIQELENKGELTDIEIQLAHKYDERRSILYGSRDFMGQTNPDSLSEEEKLRLDSIEEEIQDLRSMKPPLTVSPEDMDPEDRRKWYDLTDIIRNPATKPRDKVKAIRAKSELNKSYKDVGRAKAISDLWKMYGDLTTVHATQYYWDRMDSLIPALSEYVRQWKELEMTEDELEDLEKFEAELTRFIETEDNENLDFYLYPSEDFEAFLGWLETDRPFLYEWFDQTHKPRTVFDPENGKPIKLPYVRARYYVHTVPNNEEHVDLVYSRKYQKRRVKNEYRTGYNPATGNIELEQGVHITNRETNNGFPEFMPLSPEQGEPADSPYHNKTYYDMRDSKNPVDKARFLYLETLKEAHLKHQMMVPSRQRTWMNAPVMGLSNIEEIRNLPTVAKKNWELVKGAFKKKDEEDAIGELEGVDELKDVDQFTQSIIREKLPKIGMSQKVPVEQVSRDMLKAVEMYIFRSYEFAARSQADPVVKAIIRAMQDNNFKGAISNKERVKIFEKIYSQMILEEVPESTLNNKKMRRLAKFLTGTTALRMLADPIGGIINYGSAMVNDVIEASAGKYISLQDLGKGKILAGEMNISLMADFNKKANLSYNTLLFEYFDLLQGDFEEDLLDRSSSLDKRASWQQILMIPRKAGELMAQLAVGLGMMEKMKVKNEIDGQMYPVHKMYKKEGDLLVLKEGFYEEVTNPDGTVTRTYPWNPLDGAKFHRFRRLIERVNLGLHGNYAKLNQTEASRHAIGKLGENMKRWFMPAFSRRLGRETPDIIFEDLEEGYYRTAGVAAYRFGSSLFTLNFGEVKGWWNFYANVPAYRQNLARMGTEAAQAFLLWLTFAVVLGYFGDDKNKELEKNSWLHNTAILIALRVYSETTAYIPIPALGFQEMKRNVLTPFSLPADAVSNYAAIAQLMTYQALYWMGADMFEDDLYYSRDAGTWYSEAGDSKLLKYVYKTLGLTGLTGFSPTEGFSAEESAAYIKNFDNLQKRLK